MHHKTLYVIRHGKSDWNTGDKDFNRPLNSRGVKDAPNMGKYLLKNFDRPDHVFSSTANRSISTARLLLNKMNFELSDIDQYDNLYHASSETITSVIADAPKDSRVIYLFGHNPGLSDFVGYITGEIIDLKTCCVAIIELYVDEWNLMSRDTGRLCSYISPRDI
ncbi:MAG: histidine phosphatase family protein [Flavobacteriales bacterium]|nr:histidine phosphatase family protein [Flavobacteriales bacterium]